MTDKSKVPVTPAMTYAQQQAMREDLAETRAFIVNIGMSVLLLHDVMLEALKRLEESGRCPDDARISLHSQTGVLGNLVSVILQVPQDVQEKYRERRDKEKFAQAVESLMKQVLPSVISSASDRDVKTLGSLFLKKNYIH